MFLVIWTHMNTHTFTFLISLKYVFDFYLFLFLNSNPTQPQPSPETPGHFVPSTKFTFQIPTSLYELLGETE